MSFKSNARETIRKNWQPIPDWIAALADECMRSSQSAAGRKINKAGSVISQVLSNKYAGDMTGIEDRVRGAFMNGKVQCPIFGEMNAMKCREWRDFAREKNPSLHNPSRVMMADACPKCVIFQQGMTK